MLSTTFLQSGKHILPIPLVFISELPTNQPKVGTSEASVMAADVVGGEPKG